MAEYKSFHYLMHAVPDAVKPNYVSGPTPLTFDELYSPREDDTNGSNTLLLIHKSEKSYWRTRDRIEYTIYVDRKYKLVLVTCFDVEKKIPLRTICLAMEPLYFEVEAKAQGNRDPLFKKKDKKLATNEELHKAVTDYVLTRLNITAEELPWPMHLASTPITTPVPSSVTASGNDTTTLETSSVPVISPSPVECGSVVTSVTSAAEVFKERMCTFSKMANDAYEYVTLEVYPPVPTSSSSASYQECQELLIGNSHVKLYPPPTPSVDGSTAGNTDPGSDTCNGTGTGTGEAVTSTSSTSSASSTMTQQPEKDPKEGKDSRGNAVAHLPPSTTTTTTTTTSASATAKGKAATASASSSAGNTKKPAPSSTPNKKGGGGGGGGAKKSSSSSSRVVPCA